MPWRFAVARQVVLEIAEVDDVDLVEARRQEGGHRVSVGILHDQQLAAGGERVVRHAHAAHVAGEIHRVAGAFVVDVDAVGLEVAQGRRRTSRRCSRRSGRRRRACRGSGRARPRRSRRRGSR